MCFLHVMEKLHNGHINIVLCRKATVHHTDLYTFSFYPEHIANSIIYRHPLHYNCICSGPFGRNAQMIELNPKFRRLTYSPSESNRQIDGARLNPREDLLKDRPQK